MKATVIFLYLIILQYSVIGQSDTLMLESPYTQAELDSFNSKYKFCDSLVTHISDFHYKNGVDTIYFFPKIGNEKYAIVTNQALVTTIRTFDKDSFLIRVLRFDNAKRSGLQLSYNQNKIVHLYNCINGKIVRPRFSYDESGYIKRIEYHDSIVYFYPNQIVSYIEKFVFNQGIHYSWEYDSIGNPVEFTFKDGTLLKRQLFNQSKNLVSESFIDFSNSTEKFVEYHDNGKIKVQGVYKIYNEFERIKKIGTWKYYDNRGRLAKAEKFKY